MLMMHMFATIARAMPIAMQVRHDGGLPAMYADPGCGDSLAGDDGEVDSTVLARCQSNPRYILPALRVFFF